MTEFDSEELKEALVDISSLADKEPQVLTPSGERMALAEYQQRSALQEQRGGWMDQDPERVQEVLTRRAMNRTYLLGWVRQNLREGHDYHVLKGKKSLGKAGAEKIAGMLGLQVHWPDLSREVERLRAGTGDPVVFLTCELLRDGEIQAQGAGARALQEDGGNWNKTLKMAKKSSMIDAVLNVAGLSEVFTQDFDSDDLDRSELSDSGAAALAGAADELFGAQSAAVLESLARRRFHIDDGDWRKIPAFRLNDALRSLEEKAAEQSGGDA